MSMAQTDNPAQKKKDTNTDSMIAQEPVMISNINTAEQAGNDDDPSSMAGAADSHVPRNKEEEGPLPIRLVCLDFEVEEEIRAGLKEICDHSVRNNMHMVSALLNKACPGNLDQSSSSDRDADQEDELMIDLKLLESCSQGIYTSRVLSHHPQHQKHQNLRPHLGQTRLLQPEFWWFLQFIKQEKVKGEATATRSQFEMRTSHPNFHPFSNSDPNHLINLVNGLRRRRRRRREDTEGEKETERFVVTIRYGERSGAFRALGHILALTRHFTPTRTSSFHYADSNMKTNDCSTNWDSSVCQKIVKQLHLSHQTCHFSTLGLMVDCSRNAVLKVRRVKELCRYIALMGLNVLQLYTEDTYQIKGEPFFGYFRGPYTALELKEIDDYAHALGIEVIACIQTLGHLGQMLQWPRFGGMRDTHDVLLVGSPEVYGFIEKMIRAITEPLRSKKIHIGMDEAHGVSEGRYRQLFGHKDSCQVFTDHLNKVNQICTNLRLQPMIWSDMLFCLAAKNNSLVGYYDSSNPATQELVQSIPPEIQLIYWDYYHTTSAPYVNKVKQHQDLNFKSPAMASGIWTWSRFWTALPFSMVTISASMSAIKNPHLGVKHAFTTIWGDEGNECDIWSALPGIVFYAEHAYSEKVEMDVGLVKSKFDAVCGGCFDDFVFASKMDDLQPDNKFVDDKARFTPNLSKWLVWEEPFFSLLSPQYAGYDLERHYAELSDYLERAMRREEVVKIIREEQEAEGGERRSKSNGIEGGGVTRKAKYPLNDRLKLPQLISRVLSLKCHLRERLVHAYKHKHTEELVALAGPGPLSRLSRLRNLLDLTWRYHRELWMGMYKPFGWEVLDLRYGGLKARLETMQERITRFLDQLNNHRLSNHSINDSKNDPNDDDGGDEPRIEELEVENELIYPSSGAVMMFDYHQVSRPQYC
ncbi:hypothetical protein PCANC_06453 [Puccinia coronata f. sp. avenae]|uniref:beta-N-acetylhexosaminidase n=1 Tax=Puccinia coronata f. sp. avenae TaxID=200324 RepID=A0A2N5VW07_9BASI|nr:hypothetical protein PCANC_06453 [Puccinia coronata f. sp. avenae]